MDIDEIVRGLSEAQRRTILASEVILLRNRWQTKIAMNLSRKGLADRGRHLNQFVWTSLGLAVRAALQGEPR